MNLFFGLAITILLFPVFAAVAILLGLISFVRRGGPDAFYAMWPVMVFFHDRFLVRHIHLRPIQRIIERVELYRTASQSVTRHIPPRWIWTRALEKYCDPIAGPIHAILMGALYLRLLIFVLVDLMDAPTRLESSGEIGSAIAGALRWLGGMRGERLWTDWLLVIAFTAFVGIIWQALLDRALLRRREKSYSSILDELGDERRGLIALVPQSVPASWIEADVMATNEGRALVRQVLDLQYATELTSEMLKPIVFPWQLTQGDNLRTYAFETTEAGNGTRLPIAASYSLLNPGGVQQIILDQPLSSTGIWSKFTLLHELGHLRDAGRRALLVKEEVFLVLFGCAAAGGFLLSPSTASTFGAGAILSYLIWSYAKWKVWDSDGYAEMCADLYALGMLSPDEIERAYSLRIKTLGRGEPTRTLRLNALRWLRFRCGTDPTRWRAQGRHPPFRLRLPTLVFCLCCVIVSFVADVRFFAVFIAWFVAVLLHFANSRSRTNLRSLEEQFMAHARSNASAG